MPLRPAIPESDDSPMRPLYLVLPVSGLIIAGLVAYKAGRVYDPQPTGPAELARPAPLFELYDQHSQIVRLAAYLGRHKLLIVFFDGSQGPDHSLLLARLQAAYQELARTGAKVLAISAARPSQNRYGAKLEHRSGAAAPAGELKFPFPLLSDVPVAGREGAPIVEFPRHRDYGAFDEQSGQPREAVFVVDRSGVIRYTHLGPDGLQAPDDWVHELKEVR